MQEGPSQMLKPQVILFLLFCQQKLHLLLHGAFSLPEEVPEPTGSVWCCVQEQHREMLSQRCVSGISSGMSQVPQITLSVLLCLEHVVKFLAGRSRLSEIFLVFWKKNRAVSEQLHFMVFDVILFATERINA